MPSSSPSSQSSSRATPIGSHGMRYQVQVRYRGGMVGLEPLFVDAEMIERGARALCELGVPTLNGKIATWQEHEDGLKHTAEAVLRAALEDGAS